MVIIRGAALVVAGGGLVADDDDAGAALTSRVSASTTTASVWRACQGWRASCRATPALATGATVSSTKSRTPATSAVIRIGARNVDLNTVPAVTSVVITRISCRVASASSPTSATSAT